MTRWRNPVASGFTLIEMVMVVVILGIIAITMLPRFVSPSIFEQRGYADDLLLSLHYSRDLALARGCRIQAVVFQDDFYVMQDTDCAATSYVRSRFSVPVMRPDQASRLEFRDHAAEGHADMASAQAILVFDPQGMVRRDNGGVLAEITTLDISAGLRQLRLWGDTAHVE